MRRVLAILACGAGLAACSGNSLPTLEAPKAPSLALPLRVESEPQGAEVKTSTGQACRTPCSLTVAASGDFSVSFALNGYLPQTVPVKMVAPLDVRSESETEANWRLNPDPVFAALEVAPPPKKKAPPRSTVKKKPAPKQAQAGGDSPVPTQTRAPAAAPASSSLPPASPWPTR